MHISSRDIVNESHYDANSFGKIACKDFRGFPFTIWKFRSWFLARSSWYPFFSLTLYNRKMRWKFETDVSNRKMFYIFLNSFLLAVKWDGFACKWLRVTSFHCNYSAAFTSTSTSILLFYTDIGFETFPFRVLETKLLYGWFNHPVVWRGLIKLESLVWFRRRSTLIWLLGRGDRDCRMNIHFFRCGSRLFIWSVPFAKKPKYDLSNKLKKGYYSQLAHNTLENSPVSEGFF